MRAAIMLTALTSSAVSVLCALFLLTGWTLPSWIVIVGRWIPALASLAVMRLFPLPGGVGRWWLLRPGSWRRFLLGGAVAVGALIATYSLTVLAASTIGILTPLPWSDLAPLLPFVVPFIAIYSLSTFGEEVAWRGHLQQLLADCGFWGASSVVAGVWVLFHIPLHATLALQGTLPADVLVSSTLLLFPLGLFLSAAAARFGSVWPAVLAHALPLSALNLVQNPEQLSTGSTGAFTALTAAALGGAALLLAPTPRARNSSSEQI